VTTVACIFGSRSVEHEVSVITAQQAMAALAPHHDGVPVYIAKDGRWYTGDALRDLRRFEDVQGLLADCTPVTPVIDASSPGMSLLPVSPPRRARFGRAAGDDAVDVEVAMPLLHGNLGEDGTLQGLLEMAGVPYTGSGVAASAIAMDKRLAKTVLRAAGLPVLADVCIDREQWRVDPRSVVERAESFAPYPLYVKPLNLGSSIGVARASDRTELHAAIEVALTYDLRCIVEAAQEGIVEINCAVLGDESGARASLLEQPTKRGLLSYDDKYRSKSGKTVGGASGGMKSAQRLIPAPLDAALAERITTAALRSFAAVGAAGVARIDLMVDAAAGTLIVNEINPIPGSLSFYLFEPAGTSFTALLDELIEIAQRRHARRAASTAVFERWMLGGGPKSSG
jgi:D-alanine-D-alanine ligase